MDFCPEVSNVSVSPFDHFFCGMSNDSTTFRTLSSVTVVCNWPKVENTAGVVAE